MVQDFSTQFSPLYIHTSALSKLTRYPVFTPTKRSTERKLDIREGFCEEAGRTEEKREDEKPKDKFLKAEYNDPATEANVRNQSVGLDYRVMQRISGHLYSGITFAVYPIGMGYMATHKKRRDAIAVSGAPEPRRAKKYPTRVETNFAPTHCGVDLTSHERVRSGSLFEDGYTPLSVVGWHFSVEHAYQRCTPAYKALLCHDNVGCKTNPQRGSRLRIMCLVAHSVITNTVQRGPGIRAEVLRCLLGVPITRLLLRQSKVLELIRSVLQVMGSTFINILKWIERIQSVVEENASVNSYYKSSIITIKKDLDPLTKFGDHILLRHIKVSRKPDVMEFWLWI
ncbi:hypothetical protein G5I_10314 [Acromyrmex echinatior]|uniref:Uncharacterized protein n=1 Tax=Acromyrmex echinatior TaxID=103372 RepID=F4WWK0_ACREC|nr:hypothetical protein G5I_10314 [Acromyrmex echinatior]